MRITSSMLYDYVVCPHRVWRDIHGPLEEMAEEVNPFVELLWQRGVLHEEKVVESFDEYADLRSGPLEERFERTVKEMEAGTPLIYQGVLLHGGLAGIPDLLRKLPGGNYLPLDIKSGAGLEGIGEGFGEGRLKKHYAVQLCMYAQILKNLGFSGEDRGAIIDIRGSEVDYDLSGPVKSGGEFSWMDFYREALEDAGALAEGRKKNEPALSGVCKLCRWYYSCRKWCEEHDDLSRIFYLGRGRRDMFNRELGVKKVADFAGLDIGSVIEKKKKDRGCLRGVGEKTLVQVARRAAILAEGRGPVLHGGIDFPGADTEFFFDIEDDPTRDFVYLHGLYKRGKDEEKYVYFFAADDTPEQEENAWREFWEYMRGYGPGECAVYYYSQHEKTVYGKLREKYPDVIDGEELEAFFARPGVVDLYGIILAKTDWPLSSYSLKDIAGYLGFRWRDKTPSGVLSIQWFNDYLACGDPGIFRRIIEYNEDDCRATMVAKDGLMDLSREAG